MKLGSIYPQGEFKADCWVKVFETTITGSAANSVDITGLNGDTDDKYLILAFIKNDDTSDVNSYRLQFNNDTGNNYGYQYLHARGSSELGSRRTEVSAILSGTSGDADNDDRLCMARMLVHARSETNRIVQVQSLGRAGDGTAMDRYSIITGVWDNNTDELTSMKLIADNNNGYGVGTHVVVYKPLDKS